MNVISCMLLLCMSCNFFLFDLNHLYSNLSCHLIAAMSTNTLSLRTREVSREVAGKRRKKEASRERSETEPALVRAELPEAGGADGRAQGVQKDAAQCQTPTVDSDWERAGMPSTSRAAHSRETGRARGRAVVNRTVKVYRGVVTSSEGVVTARVSSGGAFERRLASLEKEGVTVVRYDRPRRGRSSCGVSNTATSNTPMRAGRSPSTAASTPQRQEPTRRSIGLQVELPTAEERVRARVELMGVRRQVGSLPPRPAIQVARERELLEAPSIRKYSKSSV